MTDAPPIFRKSFSISKPVKQAFLYVTGLGHFVASMNGKKLGNHEIDPATFDDSAWVAAAAATAPSGELRAQTSPPVVAHETLAAVNLTSPTANTSVFDFGPNMNGQFEMTVSGKAGASVTLTPGEFLKGGGVNTGQSGPSTYTLKGGGPETWCLAYSTIGFRYLEVSGATRTAGDTTTPNLMGAKAYVTYTSSNSVGTFMASDPVSTRFTTWLSGPCRTT